MGKTPENASKVKTAIVSVSDKSGLAEFARELSKNGVKIISSGGTYEFLKKAGINAVKVEEITGFPEMLGGRVKTLHPKIHAGILARREKGHLAQLKKHGIGTIDLVVVNLYPFRETIAKKSFKHGEAIENIDIGGPAMIRAAAKNHGNVGVVVEPSQYAKVLADLSENGFALSEKMRNELCAEAFGHTAFYDAMVAEYLRARYSMENFPGKLALGFVKAGALRYGENPHQKGALYTDAIPKGGIAAASQLNGKGLSFNNYLDLDAAVSIVSDFSEPCAAIVKHSNPCGVATAAALGDAFRKAHESDSLSAFGGIIALNRKCDAQTARQITSFFNEAVIAPAYEKNALEELKRKQNLRVIEMPDIAQKMAESRGLDLRQISGGLIAQEKDSAAGHAKWSKVAGPEAGKETLRDLEFAWKVAGKVKSNAIVIVKGRATVGIGGGLTSRVDAVELALKKAGEKAAGATLASDGFFPFKDSIELAARAGIMAIVEPGGSLKDSEVSEEAGRHGISLFFTGERHFRH